MGTGYTVLMAVVCVFGALFWGVLAAANHVTRWWVASGVFAFVALALFAVAAFQAGVFTPQVEAAALQFHL